MTSMKGSSTVRPRDAAQTRQDILRAAQMLFSRHGYNATGVRDIAKEAGVSFALVRRYYGSKLGLLRAALEDMLRVEPLLEGDRATFGRRAVSLFIGRAQEAVPVSLMLLASADPAGRELCQQLMQERILGPLAEWLGGPDGSERAVRLHLLWTGFIAAQQIYSLEQLSSDRVAGTREWLEQMSQAIADGTSMPVPLPA
ncbi:MAG TPA: TetR family transcriptional regulator [Sphingobium sp.]|nr:TetR family transcriptional regulator [Sphingobium sp.]